MVGGWWYEAITRSLNTSDLRKRLTYTCPVGYVIENPLGVYSEQPDPIPEEQFTFEVECEYDARWTPKPLHGGTIMPRCIRKSFSLSIV